MRDKGLVFEEMKKARGTLTGRASAAWLEALPGVILFLVLALAAALRY